MRRVGPLLVSTTFMTSVLANAAIEATNLCFAMHDHAPGSPERSDRQWRASVLAALWTVYLVGGILGALALDGWSGYAGALSLTLSLSWSWLISGLPCFPPLLCCSFLPFWTFAPSTPLRPRRPRHPRLLWPTMWHSHSCRAWLPATRTISLMGSPCECTC